MTVNPPKSAEQEVIAALTPDWQSVGEIVDTVYGHWSEPARKTTRPAVAGILDRLVQSKRAVSEWDDKRACSRYRWKNPHEDGANSLQEFYREEDRKRHNGNKPQVEPAAESQTPDTRPASKLEATPMAASAPAQKKKHGKKKVAAAKIVKTIPVNFGTVSLGAGTARLGIKVSRSDLSLDTADELFSGRRLNGTIILRSDEDPKQTKFIDSDYSLKGAFDVKGFRTTIESFSCGLTFGIREIDLNDVGHFSNGKGRIDIESVDELETDDPEEEGDEEEETEE